MEEGEYYVFTEVSWIDKVNISHYVICAYGEADAYFIKDDHALYKHNDIL